MERRRLIPKHKILADDISKEDRDYPIILLDA